MRLAAADLTAATNTSLYTAPANARVTFSVNLCNRDSSPTRVRIALVAAGGTVGVADYLEYNFPLEAYESVERSGLMLANAQILVVRAEDAGVSAVVYGTEEQT